MAERKICGFCYILYSLSSDSTIWSFGNAGLGNLTVDKAKLAASVEIIGDFSESTACFTSACRVPTKHHKLRSQEEHQEK